MARRNKKGSGIYEFLTASGLLTNGSSADIKEAKRLYWARVRKEYKRNRYKNQKSYTVFLTIAEVKVISNKAKHFIGGVTGYIKQAAIASASDTPVSDKKMVAEIRSILLSHYFSLKRICDENKVPQNVSDQILDEAKNAEIGLLNFWSR